MWRPSSSPAHTPDQRWTYWTRSSWEWFASMWSCSHPEPPLLPLCGPSWRWEALRRKQSSNEWMNPLYVLCINNKKRSYTNCFQKLLIAFLTLHLVFPSESHDDESEEATWGRSLWDRFKNKEWPATDSFCPFWMAAIPASSSPPTQRFPMCVSPSCVWKLSALFFQDTLSHCFMRQCRNTNAKI